MAEKLRVWHKSILCFTLLLHACVLAWSATWQSPTLNEPGHLASGIAIWKLGRFDAYRVNPPLVKAIAALPVVLSGCETDWTTLSYGPGVRCEFTIGRDFVKANGKDSIRLFNIARWVCIPFSILGGWSCFVWGRALCGSTPGLLACLLWCSSVNVLALGQLFAPEIAGSALGMLASYRYWVWLKEHSVKNVTTAGLTLGLSLLARSSWVILFGLWPLIWCVWWLAAMRGRIVELPPKKSLAQLVAIGIVALYTLNFGYLFDGTMTRLGEFEFVSHRLGGPPNGGVSGNIYRGSWMANVPIPLPREFVLGLDHQKKDFEGFPLRSYLRGEWRDTGWWYYYLYGFCVKVPCGMLGLVLLSVIFSLVHRQTASLEKVTGWAILFLPGLATLVLLSCQPTLFHHFRYVLPLFGPMFVFAARTPFVVQPCRLVVRMGIRFAVGLCVVSAVYSSIMAAPRFISYFNAFAGGAQHGHRHMIHSNLDWGQDLYFLKQWMDENAIEEPVYLACSGLFDPAAVGISYTPAPWGPIWDRREPVAVGTAGLYAISVNYVMGDELMLLRDHDYESLQNETPIHICGDTILVYRLPSK